MKLLHRSAVSERPRFVVKLAGVSIKNFQGRDVISLALSTYAHDLCLFDGARSLLQLCRGRRRPDGMVVGHGHAPVTHTASRVSDGNLGERLFSLFILERMEPGDCAIELSLGLRVTRDGEVDLPELF